MAGSNIKVGIVGGTGYTGVELLRLLAQHPQAELVAITSAQHHGAHVHVQHGLDVVQARFEKVRRSADRRASDEDLRCEPVPPRIGLGECRFDLQRIGQVRQYTVKPWAES